MECGSEWVDCLDVDVNKVEVLLDVAALGNCRKAVLEGPPKREEADGVKGARGLPAPQKKSRSRGAQGSKLTLAKAHW